MRQTRRGTIICVVVFMNCRSVRLKAWWGFAPIRKRSTIEQNRRADGPDLELRRAERRTLEVPLTVGPPRDR